MAILQNRGSPRPIDARDLTASGCTLTIEIRVISAELAASSRRPAFVRVTKTFIMQAAIEA